MTQCEVRRSMGRLACLLMLGGLLMLSGCATGGFGAELSSEPRPRSIEKTTQTSIHLPANEEFSIHLLSERRQPGLDGTATVKTVVNPKGSAEAHADVDQSGSAQAEFQLGHAFSNDTDQQMDLSFKISFDYHFMVEESPDLRFPDATIGLRLYARTLFGRTLRDLVVVEQTTESGNAVRYGHETLDFVLTIGPDVSVSVYLAGLARVEVGDGRDAEAELTIENVEFVVTTEPAPPVRAASDERR